MRYTWLLLALVFFFSACKEDPPIIVIDPVDDPYTPDPDPPAYGIPFADVPANEDVVMYEVNLRAFSPGGDLNGVTNRLDSIAALGVNVIWLMPIYPIGSINSVNSPYSVKDYKQVGAEYGTLDDLRLLVEEAHNRGMAVILDWVANHTAWDNPWLERPEWYTQVNGEVVIPPGTNWADVADLNFDNQDMQSAMISALKYWILAANVDGYRCDAADYVPFAFWKRAIDTLDNMPGRDLMLLAEGARSDHFSAGFDMNYSWQFYGKLKGVFEGQNAAGLVVIHNQEMSSLSLTRQKLRFTTNHDESAWDATPVQIFGGTDGAFAASVLAVCMGGVPLLYGSQEVGRSSTLPFFSNSPINWNENPDLLSRYRRLMSAYTGSAALKSRPVNDQADADVVAFQKEEGWEQALVLVNVREDSLTYSVPVEWQNSIWRDALSGQTDTLGTELFMPAYDARVLLAP